MNFGFVGAGKVGFSLGRYLAEKGMVLVGYADLEPASAGKAAAFTESHAFERPEDIVRHCDCLMLTVPDDAIGSVWHTLRQTDISGKIVCHCSGSLSSEVFEGAEERGAHACSLHPLMAIPDTRSHTLLAGAVFALEGSPYACDALCRIVTGLGNVAHILDQSQKVRYHCAAVFVSNFVTALAHTGAELFRDCGMEQVTGSLFQLMQHNARAVCEQGTVQALTGPVERGDAHTISRHLSCLSAEDGHLYTLLSHKLLQIAEAKHPERDYAPVREGLGDNTP